jgi:hypothetical protein
MRIGKSARKHGVKDEDIWHAAHNAVGHVPDREPLMLIGPARSGAFLEIVILGADTDDPVIIHAMPLRRKFYVFLDEGWKR